MAERALSFAKRYALITLGALLFALAFAWCFDPAHIGFGGVTGIGQMVNSFFPAIPIGAVVIVLNIPLFLLSWKLLGSEMLVSSVYAMICSSAFIDILEGLFHFEAMDKVPAALAGGVLVGAGLGLVILQGASIRDIRIWRNMYDDLSEAKLDKDAADAVRFQRYMFDGGM